MNLTQGATSTQSLSQGRAQLGITRGSGSYLGTGVAIAPTAQASPSTVNGANKDFTFTAAAGTTPSIIVFAGGIFQTPTTDYGAPVFVSGTTWKITFVNAPVQGPVTVLMFS